MILSTTTFLPRAYWDDKTALEMLKKAGFGGFDYSMDATWDEKDMLGEDYKERAEALKIAADKIGIKCVQTHAPYSITFKNSFDTKDNEFLRLVRSLEVTSILGAKYVVVHAVKDNLPKEVDFFELNKKFYSSLVPFCEKFDVCVCVENLYNYAKDKSCIPVLGNPEEHINFVKDLDSKYIKMCIDLGHSAVAGYEPEEVLKKVAEAAPSLLKVIHVHDTDYKRDLHYLPYSGNQNWTKIVKTLADIEFKGAFDLEIAGAFQKLPPELLQDGLDYSAKIGKKLIADFEKFSLCKE